jgi:hypothetical protein
MAYANKHPMLSRVRAQVDLLIIPVIEIHIPFDAVRMHRVVAILRKGPNTMPRVEEVAWRDLVASTPVNFFLQWNFRRYLRAAHVGRQVLRGRIRTVTREVTPHIPHPTRRRNNPCGGSLAVEMSLVHGGDHGGEDASSP